MPQNLVYTVENMRQKLTQQINFRDSKVALHTVRLARLDARISQLQDPRLFNPNASNNEIQLYYKAIKCCTNPHKLLDLWQIRVDMLTKNNEDIFLINSEIINQATDIKKIIANGLHIHLQQLPAEQQLGECLFLGVRMMFCTIQIIFASQKIPTKLLAPTYSAYDDISMLMQHDTNSLTQPQNFKLCMDLAEFLNVKLISIKVRELLRQSWPSVINSPTNNFKLNML